MRSTVAVFWALMTGPTVAALLHGPAAAWSAMLGYHAGCALVATLAQGSMGRRPRSAILVGASLTSAAVVLLLGCLVHAWGAFPEPPPIWGRWGLGPPADRAILVAYVLVNPWLEEWFWRGTLLGGDVAARLGGGRARALSVLGFWPLHLVFLERSFGMSLGALLSLGVFAAGLVWAVARERTGNAWCSAASHQGADFGLALLYWLFLRPAS